jgi:glutamine amidotransferase
MLFRMCRMVGYLGERMRLSELVDDAPHGLERQSWAPREMQGAVVNADGWGSAWYLPDEDEPCVYRSSLPIWADANRFSLGRAISSHCFLAAVRSATDPLSHALSNTQPFVYGPLAFLHNGYAKPFREAVLRPLRQTLCDEAYRLVRGDTDSEHYFALVVDEWLQLAGLQNRAQMALERATQRLLALTEAAGGVLLIAAALAESRTAIGAGPEVALVRAALGGEPPSLYTRRGARGSLFASEPIDAEPDWRPVAVGRSVVLGAPTP